METGPIATLSASAGGARLHSQLTTSSFIYPHMSSAALTATDPCPKLARYGPSSRA